MEACSRECCKHYPHEGECSEVVCNFVCRKHCRVDSDKVARIPGAALVEVLPPRNLRFGILQVQLKHEKTNEIFNTGEILFYFLLVYFFPCFNCTNLFAVSGTLCRTCSVTKHGFEGPQCTHTDDERAFRCSATFIELKLAWEQGYRLRKCLEVSIKNAFFFSFLFSF